VPLPPASFTNVKYGPHERNVVDLWQAKSGSPTPLVIYIHGGGFSGGDKRDLSRAGNLLDTCMKAGISVASINYRLSHQALAPAAMLDSARAVQFLRSKAKEWNLDSKRFAASGGSAGGVISLWIGFPDDMADPKSEDPVARESTRLSCMFVGAGQTSLDPRFIKKIIPGKAYKHEALISFYGLKEGEIDNPPPEKIKLFEETSPINYLTADDPPAYLSYNHADTPLSPDTSAGFGIHHVTFGKVLKERMDPLKIECVVRWKGDPGGPTEEDFYMKHLGVKK
jgi:hypothetical protein